MMPTQFACQKEGRREAVLAANKVNGIDFLEVATPDQRTLSLVFLFPVVFAGLTRNNISIGGGVRIRGIEVESVSSAANVLTIVVREPGDFSTYTLRLVTSAVDSRPPNGFDPQLSEVEFSFKLGCPSPFDCATSEECLPAQLPEPEINYLAKDYASFRRLMLDRLSIVM